MPNGLFAVSLGGGEQFTLKAASLSDLCEKEGLEGAWERSIAKKTTRQLKIHSDPEVR